MCSINMRQISRFFFSSETFVKDDYRSASDTEVYRLSTGKTPLQIFSYLFQSNQSALFCGVQQQAASVFTESYNTYKNR